MAKETALEKKVLKDVSRSFYLSLRFLPSGFRAAASVGYLLARTSDTFADAGSLAVAERKRALAEFRKSVLDGTPFSPPKIVDLPGGEERLMRRLDECFQALENLPDNEATSVRKVVGIITDGQAWDLERFQAPGLVALDDDEELRHYAYQVAGCVGEFWTELGFLTDENFTNLTFVEMNELGRAYGRSLQLINILRDVPEDLKIGRCYLPGLTTREGLLESRAQWIEEARKGLDSADRYAEALHGKRMRFATLLPSLIGRETLNRLEKCSWEEWEGGVKVSRSEVRKMMWDAVKFSI